MLKKILLDVKMQYKLKELQLELLSLGSHRTNLEEIKTLEPEDCMGLNIVVYTLYHLTTNSTTRMSSLCNRFTQ
jgi:hypothetical protein